MYRRFAVIPGLALAIALLVAPAVQGSSPAAPLAASPLGTAFTYQGRLLQGGAPATGSFGITFKLYDALSGGGQIGSTLSQTVPVTNGLFTTPLDFGAGAFDGQARWLELAVGGTTLTPRQPLTPTPYALALPGLRTQDKPTSPNVLGGYIGNTVTNGVTGATIGGGGAASYLNRVTDDYGTVSGGRNDRAGDDAASASDQAYATVGGGQSNVASHSYATAGGGWNNKAIYDFATVGGGAGNTASGNVATVAGGTNNGASGGGAAVGGGDSNTASQLHTVVSGGFNN